MRHLPLAAALLVLALALPATAFGQGASRTWVSGVGDDINPCSRTAPCRTLPAAMTQTAPGGVISALDAGSFNTLTITKAITIDLSNAGGGGITASAGVTGITVNAGPEDRVRIRGVNINGLGSGGNGIRIIQARSVKIAETNIYNFTRNGVTVENGNQVTRVVVKDSTIHDNTGNGVLVAPTSSRAARVTLRRNDIDDNGCGIAATRFGATADYTFRCGTGGTGAGAIATINAFGNSITESARQAVLANGSSATIRLGRNDISGSTGAPALQFFNTGEILSFGNNVVTGNPGGDGAPTGSAGPLM